MQPIRESMVMRARLTTLLLNPGVENELRREIYLCALLSQMDELLREPLGTILRRIPLSEHLRRHGAAHRPLRTQPANGLRAGTRRRQRDPPPVRRARDGWRKSTARCCGCCPIWKWNARPLPVEV
jgi:hypothetical protein